MSSDHEKKRHFIAVAGNMGSGKSTLVQFIASQFNGTAFYEAVDENPYFSRFFKDMRRWAFHSQVFFLTQKYRIHNQLQNQDGLVILDRTIYEDADIFARGLFQSRKMTHADFELYWSLYEILSQTLRPPDVLIYLTCSMKTLKKRIALRGRIMEKNVPTSYLRDLQKRYDDFIKHFSLCEVVTIETDDLDYISDLVARDKVMARLEPHLL